MNTPSWLDSIWARPGPVLEQREKAGKTGFSADENGCFSIPFYEDSPDSLRISVLAPLWSYFWERFISNPDQPAAGLLLGRKEIKPEQSHILIYGIVEAQCSQDKDNRIQWRQKCWVMDQDALTASPPGLVGYYRNRSGYGMFSSAMDALLGQFFVPGTPRTAFYMDSQRREWLFCMEEEHGSVPVRNVHLYSSDPHMLSQSVADFEQTLGERRSDPNRPAGIHPPVVVKTRSAWNEGLIFLNRIHPRLIPNPVETRGDRVESSFAMSTDPELTGRAVRPTEALLAMEGEPDRSQTVTARLRNETLSLAQVAEANCGSSGNAGWAEVIELELAFDVEAFRLDPPQPKRSGKPESAVLMVAEPSAHFDCGRRDGMDSKPGGVPQTAEAKETLAWPLVNRTEQPDTELIQDVLDYGGYKEWRSEGWNIAADLEARAEALEALIPHRPAASIENFQGDRYSGPRLMAHAIGYSPVVQRATRAPLAPGLDNLRRRVLMNYTDGLEESLWAADRIIDARLQELKKHQPI